MITNVKCKSTCINTDKKNKILEIPGHRVRPGFSAADPDPDPDPVLRPNLDPVPDPDPAKKAGS